MANSLLPEVRARIDAHLDAVERHLQAAGATREKRRAIADDLETQILDMLSQAKDRPPSIADIDDVLNRMDPPQAYANEAAWPAIKPSIPAPGRTYKPRICRQAKQGARYIALGATGQVILFSIMLAAERAAEGRLRVENVLIRDILASPIFLLALGAVAITAGGASVVGPIVGTSCGWIAASRLRRSGESEYGLGLAVIEALFYPFLIIWGTVYGLWHWMNGVLYHAKDLSIQERDQALILTISCVAGAISASAAFAWLLCRLTSWTRSAAGSNAAPPTEPTVAARPM